MKYKFNVNMLKQMTFFLQDNNWLNSTRNSFSETNSFCKYKLKFWIKVLEENTQFSLLWEVFA